MIKVMTMAQKLHNLIISVVRICAILSGFTNAFWNNHYLRIHGKIHRSLASAQASKDSRDGEPGQIEFDGMLHRAGQAYLLLMDPWCTSEERAVLRDSFFLQVMKLNSG